jgi:hypothetical protein
VDYAMVIASRSLSDETGKTDQTGKTGQTNEQTQYILDKKVEYSNANSENC